MPNKDQNCRQFTYFVEMQFIAYIRLLAYLSVCEGLVDEVEGTGSPVICYRHTCCSSLNS